MEPPVILHCVAIECGRLIEVSRKKKENRRNIKPEMTDGFVVHDYSSDYDVMSSLGFDGNSWFENWSSISYSKRRWYFISICLEKL